MSHAGSALFTGNERTDRPGGGGDARRRVHRVVDRGRLVGVADDVDVHEVGAPRAEPGVGQPARLGEVGEEDARRSSPGAVMSVVASSRPSGRDRSMAIERFPLFSPAQ